MRWSALSGPLLAAGFSGEVDFPGLVFIHGRSRLGFGHIIES